MKIAFTGDLVLQEVLQPPYEIFGTLKKALEKDKIALCVNLESPIIQEDMKPVKNKITLFALSEAIEYLQYLDTFLINLSNNHINDYGNLSANLTQERLQENALPFYGVGLKKDKEKSFVINEENKIINIAFCTRSSDFTGSKLFADDDFIGGFSPDLKLIRSLRDKYKNHSIIVSIHWGKENITYPEMEKRLLGRNIIDAGADLIIGHHPHIIQPCEIYRGKHIFYSLGNFYFDDIHFELRGEKFLNKSLKHQKIGLIPIVLINEGKLSIAEIWKVRVINKKIDLQKKVKLHKLKIPLNLYTCFQPIHQRCESLLFRLRWEGLLFRLQRKARKILGFNL